MRLHLDTAGDELAAELAWAAIPVAEGGTSRHPLDSDFFLLPTAMVVASTLDQREDDSRPCLQFYARSFGSNTAVPIGSACLDGKLPNTIPAAYAMPVATCEPGYHARWCADNASDCTGSMASTFMGCAGYAEICSPSWDAGAPPSDPDMPSASLDAGARDAGALDAAARDAATTRAPDGAVDDVTSSHASQSSSGCALASSRESVPGWLCALALIALSRRRSRRDDLRVQT